MATLSSIISGSRIIIESLKLHDPITLPAGHQVGMGKLKAAVQGTIAAIQQDDGGRTIYRVSFNVKGKERSTWITADETAKFHG